MKSYFVNLFNISNLFSVFVSTLTIVAIALDRYVLWIFIWCDLIISLLLKYIGVLDLKLLPPFFDSKALASLIAHQLKR